MKKFMVIYHAPTDAMEQSANLSTEQMEEGMKAWMNWAAKCGDQLIDMGTPLAGGRKLHVNGTTSASDREVAGYSILQADNMEQVLDLLKDHPHLSGWNNSCDIEIHESMPLPGTQSV